MGIGDVTEDGDLALSVDGPADGAVVREGNVDCFCDRHFRAVAVRI